MMADAEKEIKLETFITLLQPAVAAEGRQGSNNGNNDF
jgi:hypothetical protein